jgi:hypothetical protein
LPGSREGKVKCIVVGALCTVLGILDGTFLGSSDGILKCCIVGTSIGTVLGMLDRTTPTVSIGTLVCVMVGVPLGTIESLDGQELCSSEGTVE